MVDAGEWAGEWESLEDGSRWRMGGALVPEKCLHQKKRKVVSQRKEVARDR
jgi:hypothetical protein